MTDGAKLASGATLEDPAARHDSVQRRLELLRELLRRDLAQRYRGSALGVLWSLLTPLALLVTYTLVFGVFMQMRWPGTGGIADFALMVFVGLLIHGVLAEVLTRSPHAIVHNPGLVKRVRFPLELLPLVPVGTALAHLAVGAGVLLVSIALIRGLDAHALWLPLTLLPLLPVLLAIALIVAGLGVVVRDISHAMAVIAMLLVFAAPVIYPLEAVPAALRDWLYLNPLTLPIVETRAVLLGGRAPDFPALALYTLAAVTLALAVRLAFVRAARTFADAL